MLRLSVLALAVILAPFLPAAGQSIVGPGLLAKQGIIVVDGAVLDGKVYVHTLPARWDRAPKWFVSRDGRFTALTGKVSTQREYETRQCMSASGARLEAQGRLVGESGLVVLGPGGNKAVVWTAAKALGPIKTPGCIQPTRAGLIPDRDWRSYGFRVGGTAGTFVSAWFADPKATGECIEAGPRAGLGSRVGVFAYAGSSSLCPVLFSAEADETSMPCTRLGAPRAVRGILTARQGATSERWLIGDASDGPDGLPVTVGVLLSGKAPYRPRAVKSSRAEVGCPTGP